MQAGYGLFHERLAQGGYRPVVTAYYFKAWDGYDMAFHTHRSTEIMYVIAGSCRVELRPDAGGGVHALTLKKGEFIILDGRAPHRLIVADECRMLNVEFRFAEAAGVFPATRELAAGDAALTALFDSPRPYLVLRDPHEVYHVLRSLVLELDSREGERGVMAQLLLTQLLLRIARLYREAERDGRDAQELYVRQCMDYLHQNYDRSIQIKEIAAAVSLHPGYLQRIFKAKSGMSIMAYLTAFRMEKAKMLLRQTDIPVAEIADYVGVGSRSYFHLLFKRHAGMTPADYRASVALQLFDSSRRGDDC